MKSQRYFLSEKTIKESRDERVRTSTSNYIKDILGDYYQIEKHIKQRQEELRNPYIENDLNHGIKGNTATFNRHINLLITIEQDRRLTCLERNKHVISEVMEMADEDTRTIIKELYFRKWPRYTMQGLIDAGLIFCSRRQAYILKNKFFDEIACRLNLEI